MPRSLGTTGAGMRIKHPIVTELTNSATDNVEYFHETVTLTSAAAATAVNILSAARVGTGRKVYLQGFVSRVNGATNWATTANIAIEGTGGTNLVTITVNAATTNGNVRAGFFSNANVVLDDPVANGTGGAAGEGLQVVGNANGTGSDLIVTCWGIIK